MKEISNIYGREIRCEGKKRLMNDKNTKEYKGTTNIRRLPLTRLFVVNYTV